LHTDLGQLTLVAADFTRGDVAHALTAADHDRNQPSLFLCEGVLMYLRQDVIHRLLRAALACSSDDTLLAVSLSLRQGRNTWRIRAWRRITHRGEPPRTVLPTGPSLALLERAGWSPQQVTDPPERPGHARLVTARPNSLKGGPPDGKIA